MKQTKIVFFLVFFLLATVSVSVAEMDKEKSGMTQAAKPLSLITATPDEGFQLAVKLARMGVKTTQPDKEVLFMLREVYSRDADALIACSQVIAIHFQTVAAANNYWK
ncbi:MAG: hexameric tyrosine-coordinated heme protein [Syntrophotaleaceae bacterium]